MMIIYLRSHSLSFNKKRQLKNAGHSYFCLSKCLSKMTLEHKSATAGETSVTAHVIPYSQLCAWAVERLKLYALHAVVKKSIQKGCSQKEKPQILHP